jgi:hypothetical protein
MPVRFGRCRVTTVAITNVVLALACVSQVPTPGDPTTARLARGFSAEVRDGLGRVRAATARFSNLDSAVAAGYPRDVARCLADPHHGAMGFHHLNRALLDAQVEVERPEILLYERREDGSYTLTGVEYIVPYSRWPRDSVAPTVMGQALQRGDDLNLWYLHMWAWKENRLGLFANWNPAVACPAG